MTAVDLASCWIVGGHRPPLQLTLFVSEGLDWTEHRRPIGGVKPEHETRPYRNRKSDGDPEGRYGRREKRRECPYDSRNPGAGRYSQNSAHSRQQHGFE